MRLILSCILSILGAGCAGQSYVKATAANDGTDYIELENPYQDAIDRELDPTKKLSAHTVYDNSSRIAAKKEEATSAIIQTLAGAYRFYDVPKAQSLAAVSKAIYGTPDRWRDVYRLNVDVLNGTGPVTAHTKLRYLPVAPAARTPASTAAQEFKTYRVERAETLGEISLKLLGTSKKWKQLHDWNLDVIPDPNRLRKGVTLKYVAP